LDPIVRRREQLLYDLISAWGRDDRDAKRYFTARPINDETVRLFHPHLRNDAGDDNAHPTDLDALIEAGYLARIASSEPGESVIRITNQGLEVFSAAHVPHSVAEFRRRMREPSIGG
jgi:hypothetical protein